MPLHYKTGTLAEHLACRSAAAMFDVSHLGTVRVSGPDAFRVLQWAFTNDLGLISPGMAQYTHLLDPSDGSVIDDIIVWWTSEGCFDVMPNASNTGRVVDALTDGLVVHDATVQDVTYSRAVIAVQGPKARDLLRVVASEVAGIGRFKVAEVSFGNILMTVAGTGYTGEDGVELAVPAVHSVEVWQALIGAGVTPAGLGARDTLRLEAGLPLHGHELGPGITPLQAGLGWVARFAKGDFRGRAPLEAEKLAGGPSRVLLGLLAESRRPPRDGCVVRQNGRDVGVVTSGNFSPVLNRGIALAFLSLDCAVGDRVMVDVRGRSLPAEVVKPPFHRLRF